MIIYKQTLQTIPALNHSIEAVTKQRFFGDTLIRDHDDDMIELDSGQLDDDKNDNEAMISAMNKDISMNSPSVTKISRNEKQMFQINGKLQHQHQQQQNLEKLKHHRQSQLETPSFQKGHQNLRRPGGNEIQNNYNLHEFCNNHKDLKVQPMLLGSSKIQDPCRNDSILNGSHQR